MKRAVTLLIIYLFAAIFDWGDGLSFLIRYLLMALLFFSFLKVNKIGKPDITRVVLVMLSMFSIGFIAYFTIKLFNLNIAESILMVALTPTALASIVIIDIMGGDKQHAASNVLITNIFIVVILPFLLYFISEVITIFSMLKILQSTLITFFVPYIASVIVRQYMKHFTSKANSMNVGYYVWVALMYLAVSKSVFFLKNNPFGTGSDILFLVILVLLLCIFQFSLGRFIGGKKYSMETSLALGQKNNGFAVWFCLTYINPFVALGPAVYVLFQNLYLIFLISKSKKMN